MKNWRIIPLALAAVFCLGACGRGRQETEGGTSLGAQENSKTNTESMTLVYGSNDYTRINPALDEHGEIR